MTGNPNSLAEGAKIDEALRLVATARQIRNDNPALGRWAEWVKRLQCARFERLYADLLAHPDFGAAARFFLNDLYAPLDFSRRDAQFARISGTIERLFPRDVAQTATMMARLHALSEGLDNLIAGELAAHPSQPTAHAYQTAWQRIDQRSQRDQQLRMVMHLGTRLDVLTRRFGLRTALSLMRGPARAAGLSELQGFLERGFDAFASMKEPKTFLAHIQARESRFLAGMDGLDVEASADALAQLEAAASGLPSPV